MSTLLSRDDYSGPKSSASRHDGAFIISGRYGWDVLTKPSVSAKHIQLAVESLIAFQEMILCPITYQRILGEYGVFAAFGSTTQYKKAHCGT